MKKSTLVEKTDAIFYVVLSGVILAVSVLLLAFGGSFVPPIGIAFSFFAAIAAFFGFIINAANVALLYMGKRPMTLRNENV